MAEKSDNLKRSALHRSLCRRVGTKSVIPFGAYTRPLAVILSAQLCYLKYYLLIDRNYKVKEHKMKILPFILILTLLIISCDKDSDNLNNLDSNQFKGTWILYRFIDKATNESFYLPDGYSSEITFHGEDCIFVIAPCNSGPGKYVTNGRDIKIIKLAMTKMGCNILGYEEIYTDNLSGTYSINNDTLKIISDYNTDLIFFKADSTKSYDCFDF